MLKLLSRLISAPRRMKASYRLYKRLAWCLKGRGNPYAEPCATPEDVAFIRAAITDGADVDMIFKSGGHPYHLIDVGLDIPSVAQVLLDNGAKAHESTVKMMASYHWRPSMMDNHPRRQEAGRIALVYARQQPELDWYVETQWTANMQTNIEVPANMLIEMVFPGFNEALELAQQEAGLPVGPQWKDGGERAKALFDAYLGEPQRWWRGKRNMELEIDALLAPGIDASFLDQAAQIIEDRCERAGSSIIQQHTLLKTAGAALCRLAREKLDWEHRISGSEANGQPFSQVVGSRFPEAIAIGQEQTLFADTAQAPRQARAQGRL